MGKDTLVAAVWLELMMVQKYVVVREKMQESLDEKTAFMGKQQSSIPLMRKGRCDICDLHVEGERRDHVAG